MPFFFRNTNWFKTLLVLLMLPVLYGAAQTPKRPAIIGIAAVELRVSDIQKALVFYEGLLGFDCIPVAAAAEQPSSFYIRVNPRQIIKVYGGLPPTMDERLVALGFQTTDAEAMRLYLKSKGIAVPDAVMNELPTVLSFSFRDPAGHPLKCIQYTASGNDQPLPDGGINAAISDRILHAGLWISNQQTADGFYSDILGFWEIWRGGANDSITSWINMCLPESTDYLEYMLGGAKPGRQQLGSMHHIALLVPDIQKALDLLRERAGKLGYTLGSPRIGRNKRWQLNLYDPDGTRIELMEPFTAR